MPKPYSIAISGEWPGAGQTTTAKALSKQLGFIRIYAGFLFRKFAFAWSIQKNNQTWAEFEDAIKNNKFDLDSVPFQEKYFNQQTLQDWQDQLKTVDNMDMWDKIIERQSQKALAQPGTLVEAKLAVVLDEIDLGFPMNFDHKIIKILLTCPPETAAKRIIQRKIDNNEVNQSDVDSTNYKALVKSTQSELTTINLNDWERYQKIYGIDRKSIFKKDIHQIDTSTKNTQEVLAAVINLISKITQ